MNIPDKIAAFIALSLSKEICAVDEQELMDFLQEHPEAKQQYESLKKLWNIKADAENEENLILRSSNQLKVNCILEKAAAEQENIQATTIAGAPVKKMSAYKGTFLKYAAAIIILISATAAFYLTNNGKASSADNDKKIVVTAQNGSKTRVLLPDGSTVWLNAGSKLYYDEDFSGATREVKLCGEAFFDVVKQLNHPFIVHAGSINIKVLGTAFNVKDYHGDKTFETTLLHGAIEVTTSDKNNQSIFMKPNEKLVITKAQLAKGSLPKASKKEPIHLENNWYVQKIDTGISKESLPETAWIYNRLEFRGDSFEELAHKLERWYNVKIVLKDEALKALKFNGSFEKETVQQALDALQKVASFTYKINNHEIWIEMNQ